jgi:ubiquitin-conjugating enzyme E2 O
LLSLLILGPEDTPYEGNVFVFDVLLPPEYPRQPPLVHYYNRCDGRLNPNLYEDGKVLGMRCGRRASNGLLY